MALLFSRNGSSLMAVGALSRGRRVSTSMGLNGVTHNKIIRVNARVLQNISQNFVETVGCFHVLFCLGINGQVSVVTFKTGG